MFTYSEVEKKLNSSKWPDNVKRSLLPVLPRLGKWSLSYLSQQISSTGSEYLAKEISQIISYQPEWYDSLQKSEFQKISDTTSSIIVTDQENLHKALLAVILDIRSNKSIAERVPADLSKLFDQVEVLYLHNLPVSEVTNILSERLDHIYEISDLEMEIKRYCYYRDSLSKDDQEIIEFRKALENNEQPFGAEAKTIKFWINDFLQSIASTDRSAYNVVRYVTNNPAVKNLSDTEKSVLSDILKLYNWFFQPYVAEDEIENYEQTRMGQEPESVPPARPATEVVQSKLTNFDSARATPSANINTPKANPTPPPEESELKPAPPKNPVHLAAPTNFNELIGQLPKHKMGVVMDPTNIKIGDEKQRLEKEKDYQAKQIQKKLADLRNRNIKQS
jgi:hypothetical protein